MILDKGECVTKKHRKHYNLITQVNSKKLPLSIDIQTQRNQSNVKIVCIENYENPILKNLEGLALGFTKLKSIGGGLGSDFLRQDLFTKADLFDSNPIEGDIMSKKLNIYLNDFEYMIVYGSLYDSEEMDEEHLSFLESYSTPQPGIGVHNVHLNQSNHNRNTSSKGIYQDWGLFIKNKKSYTTIFTCVVGQCSKTDNQGNCLI